MDFVAEAKQDLESLTPDEVERELAGDATLIDLRESEELQASGSIPGAVHAPRGMLEFYADPSLPYHRPEFERDRRIILHCASGGRSALAAKALKDMGYTNVAHLDGGVQRWAQEGKSLRGSA